MMLRPSSPGFINSNGVRVAYDSFGGEQAETFLLISGLGAQMIRWTVPFCAALAARGFRVVRYDNRDCGRSSHLHDRAVPDVRALAAAIAGGQRPSVPYTLDDMADDAIGLLDALSLTTAHVVGRSMGGVIAQILASSHPDRVLSLTAIMSSTANPALPQAASDIMALMTGPVPDPLADWYAYLAHRLAFARRIAGEDAPFDEAAQRALILEEFEHAYDPAGTARQIAAMAATGDLRPRLAAVKAPTLIIHGAEDCLVHPDCGRDIAASIAGAEFMLLDRMGHDLPPRLDDVVIDAMLRNVARSRSPIAGDRRAGWM
ncbi:alpha/beta fold hydrolase [Rhodopseudomonas sp. B29]|uniref:alpha/beta fold hydrolase n=1 Tax=Rhodopseudomonas sp. B29 TaxID=95607 RepID=UPI0003B65949|nr:alpha/beta hydrolase [Rhodopseudomonas sp. B29]